MATVNKIMKTFNVPNGSDTICYEVVDDKGRKSMAVDWDSNSSSGFDIGAYIIKDGEVRQFTSKHYAGTEWNVLETRKTNLAAEITTVNNAKIDKPTVAGTQGQVLRSDGNGGAVWADPATAQEIGAAVEDWCDEHIPTGQGIAIDTTLSNSGEAADAKVVGDAIDDLENEIIISQNTPSAAGNKLWIKDQYETEYTVPTMDDHNELKSAFNSGVFYGAKLLSEVSSVTKSGTSSSTVYTITGLEITVFDQMGSSRAVISGNYTLEHNKFLAFSTSPDSYVKPDFSTSGAGAQIYLYKVDGHSYTKDYCVYAANWYGRLWSADNLLEDKYEELSITNRFSKITNDGIFCCATVGGVSKNGTTFTVKDLSAVIFDVALSNRQLAKANYTLASGDVLVFSTASGSYVKPDFYVAGGGASIYLYKVTRTTIPEGAYVFAFSFNGCLYSYQNILEDALYEVEKEIALDTIGYIATSTDTANLTPVSSATGYRCKVMNCSAGERFTVKSVSGSGSLPYAFIDSSNNWLEKAEISTLYNKYIIAPENAAKVIFNTGEPSTASVCYGWVNIPQRIENDYNRIVNLENEIAEEKQNALFHIENDLKYDGVMNLKEREFTIIKNGSANYSNYGLPGSVYKLNLPAYKPAHLYFEYRWNEVVPYSASDKIELGKLYGSHIRAIYRPYQSFFATGLIFRYNHFQIGRYGDSNLDFVGFPSGNDNTNTDIAFIIRYTGTVASADDYVSMNFGTSSVSFTKGGNSVGSVSFAGTDTVESLVTSINALTDFTCRAVKAENHTCSELLPVAIPIYSDNYSLGATYTDSESVTKYENLDVIVPYAFDHRWHTVEMIADPDNNKCAVAIDGLTNYVDMVSGSRINSMLYAEIGNPLMTVKNLVIDYDHFGDAEIVESIVPPYEANSKYQLVSNHNPRILIWEGHGIESGDELSVSTDRLYYLFDYLDQKGYVPITWQQFRNWKLSDEIIRLPKRCYLTMFDDYYYDNYLNLKKRRPFNKHNVYAGLAVVSSQNANDDPIVYDGKTYKTSEVWDMIVRGGWYPCSHTSAHRNNEQYSMAELVDLLQGDVLSCDEHHIYSDIIVYPYGAGNQKVFNSVMESDFKIGVRIATNFYNCRAMSCYMSPRVNLEDYITLEQLKAPIV